MINKKEAQAMLVDVCGKVITALAEENNIEKTQLNIRIDLENPTSKPLIALFHQSKFVKRSDLKAIINAGGGIGLGMLVGIYIRDVIKNIFVSSMKEFEVKDTKELFLLLYLKQEDELNIPYIAIFKQGIKMDDLPVSELIVLDN